MFLENRVSCHCYALSDYPCAISQLTLFAVSSLPPHPCFEPASVFYGAGSRF